jgi:hypothetical protein
MGARLELGRGTLRRCEQHKLVLQRDGKCALCREPEPRRSGRSIALGLLAVSVAALGAFAFDDLFPAHDRAEPAGEARVATPSAHEPPRVGPSARSAHTSPTGALRPTPTPVEDQFLRTAPAASEQTGESPPPPRAFVETEPSAPDSPQDFTLPREVTQHGER